MTRFGKGGAAEGASFRRQAEARRSEARSDAGRGKQSVRLSAAAFAPLFRRCLGRSPAAKPLPLRQRKLHSFASVRHHESSLAPLRFLSKRNPLPLGFRLAEP